MGNQANWNKIKMLNRRKTIIEKTIYPKIKNSNNKIHIAFIYGGMSSEREVTIFSKKGLTTAIHNLGYTFTPIDMGNDIATALEKVNPDIVYNGLYGTHGEDGCLPGLLEIMGLKYTHSNVLSSAVAMDKVLCTDILLANGIKCPQRKIISKKENITVDPMPRPFVIKPVHEGSSVGVELVFEKDNFDMSKYKWQHGEKMIVEKYIPGIEVEVAVFNNKAIGAIEIEPIKKRFYDYETKYTDGFANHHMPARINKEAYKKCLIISEKIHNILNCKSVSRVDFRYNPNEGSNGEFYFLETNTHPGMTPLSLVPEICAYENISFEQLIDQIIKNGLK